MPSCHRTMNEERKKRSQRRYWNFGIFLLLAACFFPLFLCIGHLPVRISPNSRNFSGQERSVTVYFDSFAFQLIKSAAFFGLFDSLFFANPWPNLNPSLISLPRETNLKFGKYFPFPFGRQACNESTQDQSAGNVVCTIKLTFLIQTRKAQSQVPVFLRDVCTRGGEGTLEIFGWRCAAGSLKPLAYTRASSVEFCYPILD